MIQPTDDLVGQAHANLGLAAALTIQ